MVEQGSSAYSKIFMKSPLWRAPKPDLPLQDHSLKREKEKESEGLPPMAPFPNLPLPNSSICDWRSPKYLFSRRFVGYLIKMPRLSQGKKRRICPPTFIKNFVTLTSCPHREFHNILIINLLHEMFLAFVHTNILMREYFKHSESEHSTLNLYTWLAFSCERFYGDII